MDFFARQDDARRKTSLLVSYFGLAVVAIIAAIYSVASFLFIYGASHKFPYTNVAPFWNAELFLWVAGLTLLVIGAGTLYKIIALRGGGAIVAQSLGGRVVLPNTTDFAEQRLLNVVEEMAIASGVTVPEVYVLDEELGINAFAAGFSMEDAVIGVTKGAMELLSREELQGVIAHEFSHILNGDMRLNLKLMGILHGLLAIALIGRGVLRGMARGGSGSRSSSSRDGGSAGLFLLIALALIIIGYVGVFFGHLIKSAVARQREYLADASAVQFTRNPLGLAGALKKIGGLAFGSKIKHSQAEQASHMYFGNGLQTAWFNALATHPPLEERIKALDPSFAGEFPQIDIKQARAVNAEMAAAMSAGLSGFSGMASPGAGTASVADMTAEPARVMATIGSPVEAHMTAAAALLAELPEQFKTAANDPFGARAVIYCLLLNREESVRFQQLDRLQQHADKAVYHEVRRLIPYLGPLKQGARLPLVDLAVRALRGLSEDQAEVFLQNLDFLIKADKRISIFEYTLRHILVRNLQQGSQPQAEGQGVHSIRQAYGDASRILSLLANIGHRDKTTATRAFAAATRAFEPVHRNRFAYLANGEVSLPELDRSLDNLAGAMPAVKKSMLEACLACLGFDGRITASEAELFRAIGEAMGCPVPLFVNSDLRLTASGRQNVAG